MKYDKDSTYILQLCLSNGVWVNVTGEAFVPPDEKALESMIQVMRNTYIQTNYANSKYRLCRFNVEEVLEF